ncbi:SPOR domain-containing protein [Paludibacterium paludis]|uniref:SPOR domain-containing protein n=1 Tax=Paludibacterium paludis TaxID=1225769 RepID=A0A918U9I6_9NEIS|nr:SPOR domain-containing protein [Paludibacterium paludis]GGY16001.1 hypothetical protein GCM10011289_19250 [Paludibacterium paludis]
MKWFVGLILVMNLLVAGYGALKVRAPQDVHAQEVSPAMLKVLPEGWKPPVESSLPVTASTPAASAPVVASAPKTSVSSAPSAVARPAVAASKPAEVKASTAAAAQCREWGPLNSALLARARGGLPGLHLKPGQWSVADAPAATGAGKGKVWVYYPPLATHAETQTLSSELKSKGFDNYIVAGDDHKGAVSLGLFGKEEAAKAMMARIRAAGYDKVAMEARGGKAVSSVISFKGLDDAAASRLDALQQRLTPGIRLKTVPCQP